MNVKNPEAYRLAHIIVQTTEQRMTQVVTNALFALQARIERSKAKSSVAKLMAIADHAAAHVTRLYLNHSDQQQTIGYDGFRMGADWNLGTHQISEVNQWPSFDLI